MSFKIFGKGKIYKIPSEFQTHDIQICSSRSILLRYVIQVTILRKKNYRIIFEFIISIGNTSQHEDIS